MKKEDTGKVARKGCAQAARQNNSCCCGSSLDANQKIGTTEEEIKKAVREGYARVARGKTSCCGSPAQELSRRIGYSEEEMNSVPEGANLGLGCGNPVALASLKEGETVLDLGSGAGFDCFLAADKVGAKGKVIGVDMTPDMLDRARENARKGNYQNVEFRLGEIENLPVADNSVDVVISNCVINLSPDKKKVFSEAYRALKPGGRLMVSDIVLLEPLPEYIQRTLAAYIGCIAGAMLKDDYIKTVKAAGFKEVKILEETKYPVEQILSDPVAKDAIDEFNMPVEMVKETAASVLSLKVQGFKK